MAAITTTTLPPAVVSEAYEAAIGLTGATHTTLAVASGSLPPGLAITDIRITGTPTQIGTFTFTVSDAATTSASLSITVSYPVVSDVSSNAAMMSRQYRTAG